MVTGLPSALALAVAQLADRRVFRLLAKSVAITVVLVVVLVWGLFEGLSLGFTQLPPAIATLPGMDMAGAVVAAAISLIVAWLTWRIVAMAVLQFFADDVVSIVEERHYPTLDARDLPLSQQARQAVRGAMRALVANLIALPLALALLVTGIGTALVFAVVNAWLLGRELQDMVWLRHVRDGSAAPISALTRFLLGLTVVALLAIPLVNLLAPFLGAAAATHLVHRAAARKGIA